MITQFGLSVIIPIVLCTVGAVWLKDRFSLGEWVVIAGILVGVGSGFCSMYNFYKIVMENKNKKD